MSSENSSVVVSAPAPVVSVSAPASPQYSPSSPYLSLSDLEDAQPQRAPRKLEDFSPRCQICTEWFEPGKTLAHECCGHCTSVICGMCLATLGSDSCIQRCGLDSRYYVQHSQRLTEGLYKIGLPERARVAEAENARLEEEKHTLEAEHERLKEAHNDLFDDWDSGNDWQSRLETDLEECMDDLSEYQNDLCDCQADLDISKAETEEANARAREFENTLAECREVMNAQHDELQSTRLMAIKAKDDLKVALQEQLAKLSQLDELKKKIDAQALEISNLRSSKKPVDNSRKRKREDDIPLQEAIAVVQEHGGEAKFKRRAM